MKKVLITGGDGDLANAIYSQLSSKYTIELPSRSVLDVSDAKSVESYFKHHSFDIVVNAAGTLYSSNIIDSEPELWIKDINVNLIGVYLISRSSVKKNKKTRIINISSTAAFNSYSDWTAYCASKAGVLKLSSGMIKDGYDVIIMCPGAIETKIRNSLDIVNPNIMDVSEGVGPIIRAIEGDYLSGDVIFYRKGYEKKIKNSDLL
ncbi:NAD(P)-dependent oxidoreductase [Vibrio sp. 10N.286.45.A3]|uniref:SDR family oxidoreductase n=1 Tax=unclassified Vibrio TaxID=2614977 RepID=UPI000D37ECAC|nr:MULTISPECIES: SDR family oxidoreductase [unclassified Vibrio]PTP00079.1 NAD(P)-dependent oxidoreductase [Vibrio sp. 10N.286.45.A3]TKE75292.1 SDR family NAD(P)-dependent oxidoreductase [Vibrio sp. F12]TKE95920.1 SDR family NAD(P)-dependent oxidoreductase [Vibrio sp. F12]